MAVNVRIPKVLEKVTNNQGEVKVEAATVREMVVALDSRYPGIQERICDESGKLRRFINVYVNDEDVRFLNGDETSLKDGDEVSIIPAIAGG